MPVDSMNKVIHAAIRRDLARLESALGTVTDGDHRRARGLHRAWTQLRDQLKHHHEQEDHLIFPALVRLGVDKGLVDSLESEHGAMARALGDVDAAMTSYAASGSAVDAADAATAVTRGRPVVEQHLAHEEADLEPRMLAHEKDPEYVQVMKQVRKQPPIRTGWFFAWLQDGLGDDEQAFLASTIPAPVRFVLSRGLGRGYHRTIAPVWH